MSARSASNKPRVAVVDDERVILESWQECLGNDYDVVMFSDPIAAQRHFESNDVDVAIVDVRMPGMDGMQLLEHLQKVQPRAEAIMCTGHGTIQTAVQAIRQGAYDFLCKPIDDLDAAVRRVAAAVERKRLREVNASLRTQVDAFTPDTQLIGGSRGILGVRSLIDQIAESHAPVLIAGESGTGKELVARALHTRSNRRDKPFLAINCAAMSEQLIDSELFGHERGAFTGAMAAHKGLFEAADGGVLFLDEIGDVPLQTQVRLLRALQEGEVRPVGATKSRIVDVRVLCATNVDLEKAMRDGRFREDLYYRVSTFRVNLPPLRDRRDDVPLIAQYLLDRQSARRSNRKVHGFTDAAIVAMVNYDWPGNVRELNNAVEHAATLSTSEVIDAEHLPSFVTSGTARVHRRVQASGGSPGIGSISSTSYSDARTQLIDDFERRYLEDLLISCEGNLSEASRRSGIDRSNLRRMLRRHNIKAQGFRIDDEES
ncbi:MAG: sigma-54-dependent Fis family transcriptional regulator [Clostridia bacterium]|nr:sigma-54-dependent Fis family transcriptional regulator [Deltaproteobacteria bacterium]